MKAIVLSGGGALGAFEAGVVRQLTDAGQTFEIVCGTSIGAINAAFVAQGKIDALDALWHGIADRKPPVIELLDTAQRVKSFIDAIEAVGGDTSRHTIGSLVSLLRLWGEIGSKRALLALRGCLKPDAIVQILRENLNINDLKATLIVTATNLTFASSDAFFAFVGDRASDRQEAFLKARGGVPSYPLNRDNFQVAVQASAAIPGAFEPINMNLGGIGAVMEKNYVDGGIANNTPVSIAVDAGATDVLVVLLQPDVKDPIYETTTLAQIGMSAYTVMQQRLLELDMELARRNGATIRFIRPQSALPLGIVDFDKGPQLQAAFEAGKAAAAAGASRLL